MSDETLSREAVALIKLGETVGQLGDSEELLREARNQCSKLRKDRLAITRAYDDVCEQLDETIRDRDLARKLADSSMLEADRYRGTLKKIAAMDTSQDASPQQCGAVLIAMNALENIK
jgi:hypothetical protein